MMQPTPAPSSAPGSPQRTQAEPEMETPSYPQPPQNVGTAPFSVLVKLFEKLATERKQERRRKLLDAWFRHWRREKGFDLYPVLRLLLPQKDRDRAVYGLKEKNLAKTYIKLIPLGMRDPDAIRLLNWKKPTERDKSSGDFPQVLCEVVSKRSSVIEGTLTIDELNEILDDIAKNMGKSDVQSKILRRIYNNSTADEQRWIIRIILKDMNISVKETTVFAVFHPDAQDLYNTCSDLKKVAWELWDPSRRLNAKDKEIQIFHAFAPMLCKRPTRKIEETVKAMGGSKFIIEEKLDGERMQLHKRGNEYFYCSRKGKDYTYLYGKHIGAGSLTPFIDSAFDSRIDDIILDGEMLVWDPVSERNLPFGTLKTAALDRSKKENNPRPCFKVFDLLYLNGMSLLDKTVKFRKNNLRHCIKPIPGRIEFVEEYQGETANDIRKRMEQVMENRGEGLVIKHPKAKYILNGRNTDWIKVKPEYMDNMGETVDVLVVAGNYGSGKRGGGVSTLICAVMDDRRPDSDDEPKYSSFVRIGTGLSFADYVWVRSKPWKVWDPKNPPEFLQTAKKGQEDKGDVYLEPEDSFILKVKAAEITPSDQYHMGFTMRFPRALAIRDDLSIADCMTATEVFESLKSERKRKMEDDAGITTKKRKTTVKKVALLPEYSGPNLKKVAVKTDIFNGMKFVVFSDPKSRTGEADKKELMKTIHANGGTCSQIVNKNSEAIVIYGGSITPYDLKLVIDKGIHDVIKPSWITDSVTLGEPAPFKKKYFFHATEERKYADEYNEDDGEEEGAVPSADEQERDVKSGTVEPGSETEDEDEEQAPEIKEEQDGELHEWLKVDDRKSPALPAHDEEDSVTEDDSDNADVADEEEPDLDDWFQVKGETEDEGAGALATASRHRETTPDVDGDVKMGESEEAMDYDPDVIFKHLCFYLDSPANAQRHGMATRPKYEAAITKSFEEVEKLIKDNGGKIVDLDEPKLTHVVLDKRDDSRRVELMKRTSKPRRRHLVLSDYIEACIDEGTLLDEEEFAP
uniref:DNA ligase 4 n=1 Tax=Coprinopsis cinerea TaxID=5346 RepID=DNLI4_COPCI|nr:RecName: Full=DNA ligase 4; AltName: Full=DNA ligase IV; AltName: Full=Polydeoxyribonucleotide synthase [ATP] 4 [Coprinopsis cinerea]BAC76766.1 DNA ligase IV [Coprinopsis cinerea]BAD93669.1 DNA ligase IV [Coprinopsis cinerea]